MDFFKIRIRETKRSKTAEIFPDFIMCNTKDLLVRGRDFYAIWDERNSRWSKSKIDAVNLIDSELWAFRDKAVSEGRVTEDVTVQTLGSFSTRSWQNFQQYMSSMPDTQIQLDTKLIFADGEPKREDYSSKRLNYRLTDGDYSAWDELVGTLYDADERRKIEWCIGAIVSGDSVDIQKFAVLYGDAGAGKSTILNIIQKLFDGYYTTFDAKALTSNGNAFSTEVFKSNPLVGIQHDGDLSRIEDNTRLNSIVSHEEMVVNEKFKSQYTFRPCCFLFMATNSPVKITDSKSGVIRRLIDIHPSGRKLGIRRYRTLLGQIDFELGAIAKHCLDIYREMGQDSYLNYRSKQMIKETNSFYNFVDEYFDQFSESEGVTLKQAYTWYKEYCKDSSIERPTVKHVFARELKTYFSDFVDDIRLNGVHYRNYYMGFLSDRFTMNGKSGEKADEKPYSLVLDSESSLLDDILSDCPAQYATYNGPHVKTSNEDLKVNA